jgi:hypothetical protein
MNDPMVIKQKYKTKKTVKFQEEDDIRYFYKSHAPIQIHEDLPFIQYSADDYLLSQPNWPARNSRFFNNTNNTKIHMENVQLVDGDSNTMSDNQFVLEGRCKALNLSAEKYVHIRYTLDLWKSFQEVQAQFQESTNNNWERFHFHIPIDATLETKTIYMALRYSVDGQDYWDNNDGKNYEIQIKPKEQEELPTKKKEDVKILAQRYDFTASLSAARKPWSPPPSPPGSPLDDNNLSYTPPIFFNHSSGITTPPTPVDEPHLLQKPIISATAPVESDVFSHIPQHPYQMSYTDFVNKYCFYNPVYSSSSAPILS